MSDATRTDDFSPLDPPLTPTEPYEAVDAVGRFRPVPVPVPRGWDAIEADDAECASVLADHEALVDPSEAPFVAAVLPSDAIIDVTTGTLMSQACRLKRRLVSEWIDSLPI